MSTYPSVAVGDEVVQSTYPQYTFGTSPIPTEIFGESFNGSPLLPLYSGFSPLMDSALIGDGCGPMLLPPSITITSTFRGVLEEPCRTTNPQLLKSTQCEQLTIIKHLQTHVRKPDTYPDSQPEAQPEVQLDISPVQQENPFTKAPHAFVEW